MFHLAISSTHILVLFTFNAQVGGTALMAASTQGHATIAAALIARGAAVDAKDRNEWSALLRASDKGHTDIVNLLINNGANPAHTDRVRTSCSCCVVQMLFGFLSCRLCHLADGFLSADPGRQGG